MVRPIFFPQGRSGEGLPQGLSAQGPGLSLATIAGSGASQFEREKKKTGKDAGG